MERICKIPLEYAGRQRTVGERFDVEPGHVEVLLVLGNIEIEPGEVLPCYGAQANALPAVVEPADVKIAALPGIAAAPKRANNRKAA